MAVDQMTKLVMELEAYHGIRLNDSQAKDYVTILSTCEASEQMARAISAWKYQNGPTEKFPAPADLVKLYFEAQRQDWERVKRASPTLEGVARHPRFQNKTLARKTFSMMDRLMNKKLGLPEYIEEMAAMEAEFPGIGWKEATEDLRRWPAKRKAERAKYTILRERLGIEDVIDMQTPTQAGASEGEG